MKAQGAQAFDLFSTDFGDGGEDASRAPHTRESLAEIVTRAAFESGVARRRRGKRATDQTRQDSSLRLSESTQSLETERKEERE